MIPEHLPVSYESVYEMIESFETYLKEDVRYRKLEVPPRLTEISIRIFYFYLAAYSDGKYPHIRKEQENALAAAFVLMGLGALNATHIPPEVVCNTYDVSERRLGNALKRVFMSLHKQEEEK